MHPQSITVTSTTAVPVFVVQSAYRTLHGPDQVTYEFDSGSLVVTTVDLADIPRGILATEPPVDAWLKFQGLVQQWRLERGAMSSITEAALCPAYQGIIGMGETAIRFILAQLISEGDDPDQWFWALKAITGADPVRDEDRGDFVAMAKSWLEWGRESRAW